MKTFYYFLLLPLLLSNTAMAAEHRAVEITLNDARPALDQTLLQNIQQTIGDDIASGIVANWLRYNHTANFKNRFSACAQVNPNASKADFDTLLTTLRGFKPRPSASYDIKVAASCNTDNTQMCRGDHPAYCFPEIKGLDVEPFPELSANEWNAWLVNPYLDLLTAEQFAAGLTDILSGKVALNYRLAQDANWQAVDATSIGLPIETKNCSEISVAASADASSISCTLKGNPIIAGKIITLSRDWFGIWTCDSDLDDQSKLRYAGKCQSSY